LKAAVVVGTLVFIAIVTVTMHAQAVTPVLFRSGVPCDLSIDGDKVGAISENGFRRVPVSAGEHLVECKGTFYIQDPTSAAPYLSSLKIKVQGTEQVVIELPAAKLRFSDLAKIKGSAGMTAYFIGNPPANSPWDNNCQHVVTDVQIAHGAQINVWPGSLSPCRSTLAVSFQYGGGGGYWCPYFYVTVRSAAGYEFIMEP
jgi:hypothetical protein